MRRTLAAVLGGALVLAVAGPAHAQVTLDTYGARDSFDHGWGGFTSGFGFGQTFVVPNASDVFLSTFTTTWRSNVGAGESYTATLTAFDNSTMTSIGPVLWSGTGTSATVATDVEFSINRQLSAGTVYLLAINTATAHGQNAWTRATNPYAGGGMMIKSGIQSQWWDVYAQQGRDLAFRAEFSPSDATVTPEPVSMALLGTGLAGIGAAARRRRRNEAEAETA